MVRIIADNRNGRYAETLCKTGKEILEAIKYMIKEEGFEIQDFTIEDYNKEEHEPKES